MTADDIPIDEAKVDEWKLESILNNLDGDWIDIETKVLILSLLEGEGLLE